MRRQHRRKPRLPVTGLEVLIDDGAGHQIEPLYDGCLGVSESDHQARLNRRTGGSPADHAAAFHQGVQLLFDTRADVGLGNTRLLPADEPDRGGGFKRRDEGVRIGNGPVVGVQDIDGRKAAVAPGRREGIEFPTVGSFRGSGYDDQTGFFAGGEFEESIQHRVG